MLKVKIEGKKGCCNDLAFVVSENPSSVCYAGRVLREIFGD
jgi:hypothetical protein